MANKVSSWAKNVWNAFLNREPQTPRGAGASHAYRPDRPRLSRGNERSIVTAVFNRIAMDVAAHPIQHVKLDENGRYEETMDTIYNRCLTLEANMDQTGRAFIHDTVLSMLDEGVVANVITDATENPKYSDDYDIGSMRTGKVIEWYPSDVRVSVYNEKIGERREIIIPKKTVALIENPFFAVINEPNSTFQRLVRKLNLMDAVDEISSSNKLDLIIQLPYTVKGTLKTEQANSRLENIAKQLRDSPLGIAYIDGTEKITQLNRPVENNLLKQVEYLTAMFYSQLNIDQSILDGTADEKTLVNYNNRIIEPILSAIVDEHKRKFISDERRKSRESVMFFSDPFKLVLINNLAEIADKFTRNEIMSSNEVRQIIGLKPSKDPGADELRNKNLNESNNASPAPNTKTKNQNGVKEGDTDE